MADDHLAAAAAVRKGPWTVDEDQVLNNYISAKGEGSWNRLPRAAGLNRTGRSCWHRCRKHLRRGLLRGKMTAEEKEKDVVVDLHSQWGNKWSSKIAEELPGRTEKEVMNIQQQKKRRRQHDITAAAGGGTPASTEGQGRNSGGGGATTGVDNKVIVPHQQPLSSVEEGQLGVQQAVPAGGSGAAGGRAPGASAASVDHFFLTELWELLAEFGENFDSWWMSLS